MEVNLGSSEPALGDPLLRRHDDRSLDVGALFGQHHQRLTGLAAAIVFDRALAEEIVQDAFAGLQRHAGSVENPPAYVQRSVVNLCIKAMRRRRIAAAREVPVAAVTNIPELDETWAIVQRLPVRQRAVVVMRYWQDLPEAEIADILGWPAGTVKSTLHRALQQLKKELPR